MNSLDRAEIFHVIWKINAKNSFYWFWNKQHYLFPTPMHDIKSTVWGPSD